MRRLLLSSIFGALLLPAPARPCMVVGSKGTPMVTAVRAVARPPSPGIPGVRMRLQVAVTGAGQAGRLGLILPLPAGARVRMSKEDEQADALALDDLAQQTEPVVVAPTPSCGGCGGPAPLPGDGTGATAFGDLTIGPYTYRQVRRLSEVQAWLDEEGFAIGAAFEARLESHLRGGGLLLLVGANGRGRATGAFRPIGYEADAGAAVVPLSFAAGCMADPVTVLVFAAGASGVVVEGDYLSLTLDELEPERLAGVTDLTAFYSELSTDRGRALLVTELSLSRDRVVERGIRLLSDDADLLGGSWSWLTRIRGVVAPGDLMGSPILVPSDNRPEVSGIIDLRRDVRAHGATVAGGPGAGALVLVGALLLLRAVRRRR